MASSTKNVRIGPCQVFFGGIDLGYTKGGVEVDIKTDTYKSEIDQFGKTPITEIIMARILTAKVPMAEATIYNLQRVFPGATVAVPAGDPGVRAFSTVTIASNPTDGATIVINGVTVTFKTTVLLPASQVQIGTNATATAANLVAFHNASVSQKLSLATATNAAGVVTYTYDTYGVEGNTFTTVNGTAAAAVTFLAATLTGGVEPTNLQVSVTDGTGVNLLSIATELRFHPIDKIATDISDDFVIPLAATAGGMKFKYMLETERVYDCEFSAYPDPTTRKLFAIGV